MIRRLRDALPHGQTLPEHAWKARHRFMLVLLWAHVPVILAAGVIAGAGVGHGSLEASIVASIAACATLTSNHRVASALVATGLLTCSGILVHLSGGYIELHFHFFVMVALLAMYEDWLPFGLAVAYVLFHHGVIATVDPNNVFNHSKAQQHPWAWAGIHAGFILAAGSASIAFWRMNEDVRREANRARDLQSLTDTALSRLSAEHMLDELLARLNAILRLDTSGVLLLDPGTGKLRPHAAYGIEQTTVDQLAEVPLGVGLAGKVAGEERTVVVDEVGPEDIVNPALARLGINSIVGTPLLVEGRVTGVLMVASRTPRKFGGDEVDLLELVADRVALAVHQTGLYEQEKRIAETLQRSLLPRSLPDVPGVEISTHYLPGGEGTEVGGDWFDVIALPGGQIGIAIGDVQGRGIQAAALMGQLRNALRAYALDGHSPAAAVARVNRLLADDLGDSITTLIYMVLDPEAATLTITRAGHLPALVVSPSGTASFLDDAAGLPLGALPTTEYEERVVALDTGTSLVLYTDGLVERPGESLEAGLERLRAGVPEQPMEPDDLCADLIGRLLAERAGSDDVTLLALRTQPIGDRLHLELPAEPRVLSGVRRSVRRWLAQRNLPDAVSYEIALACDEACTNAIEHAQRPGRSYFELTGFLTDDSVEIRVRDHGQWRKERVNDRGRGLSLIDALMDEVRVLPGPQGTTVTMQRRTGSAIAA